MGGSQGKGTDMEMTYQDILASGITGDDGITQEQVLVIASALRSPSQLTRDEKYDLQDIITRAAAYKAATSPRKALFDSYSQESEDEGVNMNW